MTGFSTHRRRETLVSAVINTAFSAIFYAIVFGRLDPLPVRGMGAFAFDFLPQSAAIGLMASLIPGLLMRRALAHGAVSDARPNVGLRRFAMIVSRSAVAAICVGAVLAILFWTIAPEQIGQLAAVIMKLAYGAILGATVTYATLSAMVGSRQP